MRKSIAPYVIKAILNPKRSASKRVRAERKRRRRNEPHRITIYVRINDAYSYLLLQILDQLQKRYPVEYEFRTVLNLQADMYPAPQMWHNNAFDDCLYLAKLYDLEFPQSAPTVTQFQDAQITSQLLHWELQADYLTNALAVFGAYWSADTTSLQTLLNSSITESVECYQHHLKANETLLKREGHYLSAMLHYGGEWYWGLNRLHYLEQRLNELGLSPTNNVVYNRGCSNFCQQMSSEQVQRAQSEKALQSPIEMVFSARSPYSYLGLVRARQLANHYALPLIVKPVLPMVMRRMDVPKRKGRYILFDAYREAVQQKIPFGFIADPLGKGVENTYALYTYAKSHGKEVELLESVARGVWAEGIRADTENGLSKLVSRAGLNWQDAKQHLGDKSWRELVQDNLAELYASGQWGVPCFKFDDTVVFGQDRLDRIEFEIVRVLNNS